MASEGHEYFPTRKENILNPESRSHDQEEGEKPIPLTSDSSTDDDGTLQPTRTNETTRERQFEPIIAGDREELKRIASGFEGSQIGRTFTHRTGGNDDLQKQDTLAGVNVGDSVLDPNSPDFDVYKWTRM